MAYQMKQTEIIYQSSVFKKSCMNQLYAIDRNARVFFDMIMSRKIWLLWKSVPKSIESGTIDGKFESQWVAFI